MSDGDPLLGFMERNPLLALPMMAFPIVRAAVTRGVCEGLADAEVLGRVVVAVSRRMVQLEGVAIRKAETTPMVIRVEGVPRPEDVVQAVLNVAEFMGADSVDPGALANRGEVETAVAMVLAKGARP